MMKGPKSFEGEDNIADYKSVLQYTLHGESIFWFISYLLYEPGKSNDYFEQLTPDSYLR